MVNIGYSGIKAIIRKENILIASCIIPVLVAFAGAALGADVGTSASIANSVPVASSAMLNSAVDITLTANETTAVEGIVTISDDNGCSDINNVTATLFRTNVTGGTDAPDDNRSHYSTVCTSSGDCIGGADTTESFSCDFDMLWYSDPTDGGSIYQNTDWTFNATPTDGYGGESDTAQQEVLTLTSIAVLTDSIAFGEIALGADTGAVNQNTTLANHGNENLDVWIKGYGSIDGDGHCMLCTTGNVSVDMLEFDSSPFVYGAGQDLGNLDEELDLDLDRGNDTTPRPEKLIYYGLAFPAGGISGSCSGTIVITAQSDPTKD